LSLHSSEATQAKTFHARSSPTLMQIKPQPAPTILGQESVHTTLSITHHTKERPSTGPRKLWSSIYPHPFCHGSSSKPKKIPFSPGLYYNPRLKAPLLSQVVSRPVTKGVFRTGAPYRQIFAFYSGWCYPPILLSRLVTPIGTKAQFCRGKLTFIFSFLIFLIPFAWNI
jgi:hypothetical protein